MTTSVAENQEFGLYFLDDILYWISGHLGPEDNGYVKESAHDA